MPQILELGIDIFISTRKDLVNQRIALLSNIASVTSSAIPSRLALVNNGFNLVKLFSPEHGLNAKGADGKHVSNDIDELTGLIIISLYGDKLTPSRTDLDDIDVVLIDLPDIGCRFYTYLWTTTYMMEACSKYGIPVIITDRPNPLGGEIKQAEGPMLDEKKCSSFLGRWNIPLKHACTLGELANYLKATKIQKLQLTVIPLKNWDRKFTNQIKFRATSPAMQNLETALLYPGTGLLEGLNVNEGRGTNKPFRVFGAPWIESENLQQALSSFEFPYLKTETITYTPTEGIYENEVCYGLYLEVTNNERFKPAQLGITLLHLIINNYPDNVKERLYRTVANPSGEAHLDKLLGIKNSFKLMQETKIIKTDLSEVWEKSITPFLMY